MMLTYFVINSKQIACNKKKHIVFIEQMGNLPIHALGMFGAMKIFQKIGQFLFSWKKGVVKILF